ncbi:unnamed protein product [Vitrella brassicaformis CCMP3155]|uniref:AAA+ ATPase domain-containing protein n=4 Tax=Vitrella brassicaformis TaxID=1169539 RepID=A0A0G4GHW6_VITBC|nr:unnamed protein product [Vitrella brassicaformis CCMP3155]|eukprot:CEM29348.1 unnamed protein product [Vitrella brassicaformis CCMP3155]
MTWPVGTPFSEVHPSIRESLAVFLSNIPQTWSKDDVRTNVTKHCERFIKAHPEIAQSCKVPEIVDCWRDGKAVFATVCCKDLDSRRIFDQVTEMGMDHGKPIKLRPYTLPPSEDRTRWPPFVEEPKVGSFPSLLTFKTAYGARPFFMDVVNPLLIKAEVDKSKTPVVALHEQAGCLAVGVWTEIDNFQLEDPPSSPSRAASPAFFEDLRSEPAAAGQSTLFSHQWWSRVGQDEEKGSFGALVPQSSCSPGQVAAPPSCSPGGAAPNGSTSQLGAASTSESDEEQIVASLCQIIDGRGGRSHFKDGIDNLAPLPLFRERVVGQAVQFGWIANADTKAELRKLYERLRKLIRRREDVFEVEEAPPNTPAVNFKVKLAQGTERYLAPGSVNGTAESAAAEASFLPLTSNGGVIVAVLELEGMGCQLARELLNGLLASPFVLKVAYNLPTIVKALELPAADAPSSIRFCWDLQLAYDIVHETPLASLSDILTWVHSVSKAASNQTVAGLLRAVDEVASVTTPEEMRLICKASDRRLARMAAAEGEGDDMRARPGETEVGFDPQTYQMRSIEVLAVKNGGSDNGSASLAADEMGLKDTTDIKSLLQLVHSDFWERGGVLEQARARNEGTEEAESDVFLVEIVMYIGQRPHAITREEPKKRYLAPSKPEVVVDTMHLDFAVDKLGGKNNIGPDNRAVLPGSLHRISAIRDKSDERVVIGLTMRVGRAMKGNTDMVQDLLLSPEKGVAADDGHSILFLGAPGCGKTTIIREASRVLTAKDLRVCIVDTSNEICGGGHVLHPSVGEAIRLMVRNVAEQDQVMIEAVQNHTPVVLIIDEIGHKSQVDAARTVAQRKVRLLASAHGDFVGLMRNPELRGLLGGFETVILGDARASREGSDRKTRTERKGEPPFDVMVELQVGQFDEWRIILDVAKSVDAKLQGKKHLVQVRRRCPSSGRVFVRWEDGSRC